MKFIKNKKKFQLDLILEGKVQALKILRDNGVSKSNSTFTELIKLLNTNFKSLNFLGMMTKFIFIEKISFDEIKDLIKWLHDNKGTKLLSKPLMKYKRFEELKDEIVNIDLNRKIKLVLNELPSHQKSLYNDSTDDEKKIFNGWAVKLHKIKYKKPFLVKLSKLKSMNELLEYIENFVRKNSNIKTYQEKIDHINNTDGANIISSDSDSGIIVAEISNFNASKEVGSTSWCISTGIGSWSSYVYQKKAFQYFIWNYSLSQADPLHLIGATVILNNVISDIHDINDHSLKNDIPMFIKDLKLRGITEEEYLERVGEIRGENRQNAKYTYDSDENILLKAEALQKFFVEEDMWLNSYDIYDITPHNDYSRLLSFKYDSGDGEVEYTIGTDEEATSAFYQYEEDLVDDIGIVGSFAERAWEVGIDGEKVANYFDEEDYVRENPDDFDIPKKLTDKGEKEIEELTNKFYNLQDGPQDESKLKEIEDLDRRIEEISEFEIDHLWEYDETAIENYLESEKERIKEDPKDYLIERDILQRERESAYRGGYHFSMDKNYEKMFLDLNKIIKYCIDSDGESEMRGGALAGYDGVENHVNYQGVDYYIYRTN